MADNRLYIYDPETNKACGLAKHFGDGWYVSDSFSKDNLLAKSLDKFFNELESNKGLSDYDGTELKLLVEGQLPKDVVIIRAQ